MKLPHICVIGSGNVGKRHVQALAQVPRGLSISIVDPSPAALAETKALFEAGRPSGSAHMLCLFQDIEQLPKGCIDVAIVATTSDIRADIVETLLRRQTVVFLVLEKILFQQKSDYERIGAFLGRDVTAWVNCFHRTLPFHRSLRKKAAKENPATITLAIETGRRYGLMTNAIHHADFMSFLAGSTEFTVDLSSVSPKPIPSKRAGFLELSGALRFSYRNGLQAFVMQLPVDDVPRKMTIITPNWRCRIDEMDGMASIQEGATDSAQLHDAPYLRQSAMTGPLIEEILATGQCGLPTYEESARIHLNLLEPVSKFLTQHGCRHSIYPFT